MKAVMAIVVVCGWCKDAREKTLEAMAQGAQVSHGMCPSCAAKFEADLAS